MYIPPIRTVTWYCLRTLLCSQIFTPGIRLSSVKPMIPPKNMPLLRNIFSTWSNSGAPETQKSQ